MNRTERLYAIVEELRVAGPAGRSSTWLADRYEVSARTIKRDMAALAEVGVAVYAEEGRGGGYRLLGDRVLPPLAYTVGEATAIAVALAAEPDLPFGPDGRAALTKLLGAMTPEQRAAAAAVAGRVWMRVPTPPDRPAAARVVDEAVRHGMVVRIGYVDADGRVTRNRPIEPLAVARTSGHWYVLAWCRRGQGPRWFRTDRITSASLTTDPVGDHNLAALFGPPPEDAHPVSLPF